MTSPAPELFQRWYHSFEEDTDEEEVWRPAHYAFAPSRRPRRSMEFRPDGTYVEYEAGAADQEIPVTGQWETDDGDRIGLRLGNTTRRLEIVAHDPELLRIRK